MKNLRALLALLFLAAVSDAAQAATYFRMTGSPFNRKEIHELFASVVLPGGKVAYTGTSLDNADYAIFETADHSWIYKTSWSCSGDGIHATLESYSIKFIADSVLSSQSANSYAPNISIPGGGTQDSSVPDVTFSLAGHYHFISGSVSLTDYIDGVQPYKWVVNRGLTSVSRTCTMTSASSTVTVTAGGGTTGLSAGMSVTCPTLVSGQLVIPAGSRIGTIVNSTQFTLVNVNGTSPAATANLTGGTLTFAAPCPIANVTSQTADIYRQTTGLAMSQFTGKAADQTTKVWSIGRGPNSGMRMAVSDDVLSGSWSGINVNYQPTISSGAVISQVPWPATAQLGASTTILGDGGFATNAEVVNALQATTSAINGYYLTYLPVREADAAINGGAKELTYNGVPYSLDAVKEGRYSLWSHKHIIHRTTLPSGLVSTVSLLRTAIRAVSPLRPTSVTGYPATMYVNRFYEGSIITPSF